MKVLLVYGGRSAERTISFESADFVRHNLEQAGHDVIDVEIGTSGEWISNKNILEIRTCKPLWELISEESGRIAFDIVFPVLHGPLGEDGTIQGLCAMASWPCAGADVMASSVAMNKIVCKMLLSSEGIPVVEWVECRQKIKQDDILRICELGYPVFIKPARLGSSVGISMAYDDAQLEAGFNRALKYDEIVLVEKAVENAREIEVSILGDGSEIISSVPGEILAGNEWYDYEAKYGSNSKSELVIPAELNSRKCSLIRKTAEKAFSLLGGRGYARVDFLLGENGKLFLSEINTIPGFTEISMFTKLWAESGIDIEELFDRILQEAIRRPVKGLSGENT